MEAKRSGVSVLGVSLDQGLFLKVHFGDGIFTFHSQWLHDARNDRNPSRAAEDAFMVHVADARILHATHSGEGVSSAVHVTWVGGTITSFPSIWLRVLAPLVAKPNHVANGNLSLPNTCGWTVDALTIPEVDWNFIFPQVQPTVEQQETISIRITDMLLHEKTPRIIKIVNVPEPDVASERDRKNTLVTKVLKQLFGQVFIHPRRAPDETFNITDDYGRDKLRGEMLHNYITEHVLLPHCDHAHYDHPAQIQGLYCLEGESYNTFVSSVAVFDTMRKESPDLAQFMIKSPMAVGRVAHFYDPPMFQATVEPAVTLTPGFGDHVKRIRWHPHLSGSLVTPFEDFIKAREAYQKFQEIIRRPKFQLKIVFKPGDLYIWNNFQTLHGREGLISTPRTSVGQTVPEQVVSERYRSSQIKRLKSFMDENWLVHVPTHLLYDMSRLVGLVT